MPKWLSKSRFLQLRVSHLVLSVLFYIVVKRMCGYFAICNYPHVARKDVPFELYKETTESDWNRTKPNCSYDDILQNNRTVHTWHIPQMCDDFLSAGIVNGSFIPECCNPLFSVAVLVAYRNRPSQLKVFLPYMHIFLRRQRIHYKIFVIEQQDSKPFNRGYLFNIGARYAMQEEFPCLIFHDVDLLPLNEANLYACTAQPRHMSSSIDKFRFMLPYVELVGGVLSLRADHFRQLNGFSNRFFGWGGEDDDIATRMADNGLEVSRFPREMSEYTMLMHRQADKDNERMRIRAENKLRKVRDGLDSMAYESVRVTHHPLMTLIGVKL